MSTATEDAIAKPARWSLRLFGAFELRALPDDQPVILTSKRDRVLLAYLMLSPGHRQPRRKLTSLLWGEASDETSLDNLRVCVWGLRKALGDTKRQIIVSDGDDIVVDSAAFVVDVLQFRLNAGQGDTGALEAAAALYAGELLHGLTIDSETFESWRRAEALRLRAEFVDVLFQLMTQAAEGGRFDRAIEIGERLLALDPLHEGATRCLMRAHNASGRRSAAIQLYRALADRLQAQLEAQPEAETSALYAEITRGGDANNGYTHLTKTADPASNVTLLRPQSPLKRKAGWIAAGALAAAAAIAAFVQIAIVPPARVDGVKAAKAAAALPANAVSIAVLPFVNLSGDAGQDFFSDGITEEISAALARVPDLRIVARTSAFQFKGQNRDIPSIGRQLRATHIIEGSVRKEGDRVRITAQLIDASSGVRLSSDTYDRKLSDIFSTQEDIARNVVAALMSPVGLGRGEQLVASRDIDPESYQQFLHTREMVPRSGFDGLMKLIGILEAITARYPDFAPAWAQLALVYQRIPFFSDGFEYWNIEEKRSAADKWLPKSEAAAKRAIALDPNLPASYTSLGLTMAARSDFVEADRLLAKALTLDPLDPEALHTHANLLVAVGHTKEALATRRHLMGLEPFVLMYTSTIPDLLWINGDVETAISNMTVTRSPVDLSYLAKIYAGQGRRADALNTLNEIPAQTYPKGLLQTAVRLMDAHDADTSSLRSIRLPRRLNFVYITAGAPEQALDLFERDAAAGYISPNLMVDLWTPIYASVRKTERFKAFARNAGLVDYWRAKGWPDFCHATTADDFACE
jgi:TolB-like protein/DNA-binding SARP family transcriptional activator